MATNVSPSRLQSFLKIHEQFEQEVAGLRRWWMELEQLGEPRYDEMGHRLRQLGELLAQHFEAEERGGYLKEALERAPRFAEQAAGLRLEHPRLLKRLDRLVGRLQSGETRQWDDARREFESFVTELHEHEQAENAIIRTAVRKAES